MRIKYLLPLLVCIFARTLFAQDATDSDAAAYFIGHPMLADKGYKVEGGKWAINIIGEGSIQDADNMTDGDPRNYASTINLAHATVALDQIVRVLPDAASGVTAPKYGGGTEVGFVIAPGGSAGVNVINLDVIRMMVIYFYNGDERVATVAAGNTEESGLLNLNVAQVSPGGQQKNFRCRPCTGQGRKSAAVRRCGLRFRRREGRCDQRAQTLLRFHRRLCECTHHSQIFPQSHRLHIRHGDRRAESGQQ